MTKREHTLLDDIVELGRELLEKLDEALHPEKYRKPVRVPIPVRSNYPPMRDPHDSDYR